MKRKERGTTPPGDGQGPDAVGNTGEKRQRERHSSPGTDRGLPQWGTQGRKGTKNMEETVKISVLMGVYDPPSSRHLYQAVRSIISQTFSDWEMILYDDGSARAYVPVIQKAAAMDSRIRYIRGRENRGLAHALNAGLALARGTYIARMDGDDVSKPERLWKLYEFLEGHPQYQWAGSNTELIDDSGRWGSRRLPEVPGPRDFLNYSPYIHPAVMFRKQVLLDCNGYRETRRGEDYELFMRLHAAGLRGYNLQEELFQYREDAATYAHRKYRYQVEEVGIRFRGFHGLGILNPLTVPYALKPLIVGAMPHGLLAGMKKHVRKEMYVERYKGSQT